MLILTTAEFGNSAEQELKKEHLFMVDFEDFCLKHLYISIFGLK